MNVIKAVKKLVAENEALKAEIEALKAARCEKCALEEKIKGMLEEAQALSAATTINLAWIRAKGESK